MFKIAVNTSKNIEMVDITSQIQKLINQSEVKSGVCLVYCPHTTAGLTINENADPDVVHDILKELNKIVPLHDSYRHMEGNSAAHLKASLFGFSENIIIEDGRLVLGTWQGIYFCEFDGPRQRQIVVKLIKD